MSFTVGSLFDGSGGFPLAAFLCGGIPVWASEIEPYPIAVTKSRFPHMKHLGSVTDINGAEIEPVDVITFGSPCQDLSVAGKRAGLKHEDNGDEETTRSGLFIEAVRIIKEMREATNGVYPRIALWENVPGAFSSNKGEDFRLVLEELIKICEPAAVMPGVPKRGWPYADSYRGNGWSLAYRTFDAQYWGVPQRRRRIYLVLDLTGQCAGEIQFERDGLRGYFAEGRTPWQTTPADVERGVGTDNNSGPVPSTLKIRSGCEGGGKGALIQENKCTTLSTNQDQYLFQWVTDQHILDDQGGQQICVRNDGKAPTLRAEAHGNIPAIITPIGVNIYDGEPAVVYMPNRKSVGCDIYNGTITGDVAASLTTATGQGASNTGPSVICVATQQGGAEITENGVCPTITAAAGMSGNNQPWCCFRKMAHPRNSEEGQGWEPTEVADTLNVFDVGEKRTPILAVFENHSQDTRYTGPVQMSQTVSATFGSGGNNTPFVVGTFAMRGFGDYTKSELASSLKTRDYKDATDIVCSVDCRNLTNSYEKVVVLLGKKQTENRHFEGALAQLHSLPLSAKIEMTKRRIETWYESWSRYEIRNTKTGKTRYVTWDTRDRYSEPPLKQNEVIEQVTPGCVWLSFSGGKDSTVLKHIVDSMYDDVPSVFVDTGLEYPEVRMFASERADVILRPEMRFDEVIKNYGYPVVSKTVADAVEGAKRNLFGSRMLRLNGGYGGRKDGRPSKFNIPQWRYLLDAPFNVSAKCCDVMKKKPAKKYMKDTGRMPILATMASESSLRKKNWYTNGCNSFNSTDPKSQPMSFWTEQDVLEYIRTYNLPYASVYGEIVETDNGLKTTGCERTGCMFCMFGCHLEKGTNRFQRMKETHPRQYEYCMKPLDQKGLGLKDVLEYIGVPHE